MLGLVQGVGFRPFVHRLASTLRLAGFVRNHDGCVNIEVEGAAADVEAFVEALGNGPALARVLQVLQTEIPVLGETGFVILPSTGVPAGPILLPPDIAPCEACLAELFDPGDRRHRHPFLNCTDCGPRFTVVRALPYDRATTTMDRFPMCAACQREYDDPGDRRFHAQPTACPACGPQLRGVDPGGAPVPVADALAWAARTLKAGQVLAIKGVGGYHLACDARNQAAVARLRQGKQRDAKPFAVMVADLTMAERLAEVGPEARELLASPIRPIVLLPARDGMGLAPDVAPGLDLAGLMLPSSPLHHLLFRELENVPLVMTSGNMSDAPMVHLDDEAVTKLGPLVDGLLIHDREIHVPLDDSVVRVIAKKPVPVRRARGLAPGPIALPVPCRRPTLAVGGHLKATFALGRDAHALLSSPLGDLDGLETWQAYERALAHHEQLFGFTADQVVHDLHPDYATTRYARASGKPCLAVQHHHAHMASCMADNGLNEPVIGVVFDGAGLGPDGTFWGGEFLVGDCRSFRRAGHLRTVPMPGGAVREPWRMALAHLADAGVGCKAFEGRLPGEDRRRLAIASARAPLTSSAGRLFDAVAALAGVCGRVSFEAQAAMALEALATRAGECTPYPTTVEGGPEGITLDTRPCIRQVASEVDRDLPPEAIAARFHAGLAAGISQVCAHLRASTGLSTVVLSGGVFLNAILTEQLVGHLSAEGFRVYWHHQVPPGDGGLALGQLAIAAAGQEA